MSFIVIEGNATDDATLRVSGEQAIHFVASELKGTRLMIAENVYVKEDRDRDQQRRQRRRINADQHGVSTRYAPAPVPETITHLTDTGGGAARRGDGPSPVVHHRSEHVMWIIRCIELATG